MSDTTLYRIDLCAADAHGYDTTPRGLLSRTILDGVLVPVETCEHGNTQRHVVASSIRHETGSGFTKWSWCDPNDKEEQRG